MDLNTPLDFSTDLQYNIKFLCLGLCGESSRCDWANNKGELRKIIEAISKSTLKDSLEEINIHKCGVAISEVKQMLTDEGISNIKITNNKVVPCY